MFDTKFDVIVVGAGHAGCEAAAAAANLGSQTLLITMNLQNVAQMSCNPAMGGIAKGQIVREIDALGGYSGIVSDRSAIQYKMLNQSKGPAMWSPRVQSDRSLFTLEWRSLLEQTPNLDFYQDMVVDLIVDKEQVIGVKTALGLKIYGTTVVLTNGTFLNGLIHIGEKNFGGGRAGERASTGLTESIEKLGFISGRMKTGTPPRVDGRSLDYSKMEEQPGDSNPSKFSFTDLTQPLTKQISCHITHTNNNVHDILRTGFDRSPMFNGSIKSTGPRYCPSIEDKIDRFRDKSQHQVFVEPEGWNTVEVYVNGFSTSLPDDIQYKALKQVRGFENVKFFRPGYAIEYDYFPPTQLFHSLETKNIQNLFFAGQINGTTGYEEAGAQGIMAGINAHLKSKDKIPFILGREEAYIGVLIDDLILKGTEEPYRMFTSRAEYRTLLRQDNADQRLTPRAHELGLASDERLRTVEKKEKKGFALVSFLKKSSYDLALANELLREKKDVEVKQTDKYAKLLSRPNIKRKDLLKFDGITSFLMENEMDDSIFEQAEIEIKYAGYIEKERRTADKLKRLENIKIPFQFNYDRLASLSHEAKEKLNKIQPSTLAQAARISGINPSDISVLLVSMGR
ncbi:tRNA uridine-5-carboxymethylaminomethyl(34) synthesis enzyme MnmG [Flavobacteriaceae bacterium]|nr:tRNA uridine-5-carboxymethylaminomethyl(34) synthesis enzyme MnmG [Flavobacteriaceae bacterium]MDA9015984.1 tRNA uridine-5-carboxymethylaminomethyl(34) synthesis enzyme MnmG [Flavobacteriaceae bacterium]MDB3862554.1 tRNA uridine-5-carboxymethylaminomethyl(34) synthesis enzyme MnmG [Flavobacteriaceae bacterium]MDC3354242.1 tRNA uridine-5-carboxymethylaminomethyl(34) synthesis enzyme MnmG [Flavobacteriaceae bacterium]